MTHYINCTDSEMERAKCYNEGWCQMHPGTKKFLCRCTADWSGTHCDERPLILPSSDAHQVLSSILGFKILAVTAIVLVLALAVFLVFRLRKNRQTNEQGSGPHGAVAFMSIQAAGCENVDS